MPQIKDLGYFRALPYTRRVELEEEEGKAYYVASILELPGCFAVAPMRAEAVAQLKSVFDQYIEAKLEWGSPIPEPEHVRVHPSRTTWPDHPLPDAAAKGPTTKEIGTQPAHSATV